MSRAPVKSRRQQQQATRNRVVLMVFGAIVLVVGIISTRGFVGSGTTSPTPTPTPSASASGIVLASPDGPNAGQPVDGISCLQAEQLVYHIHADLIVFVDGQQRIIPGGIGIAPPRTTRQTVEGPFVTSGSCFYWLHAHTQDGIIHVESPVSRTFTLGNYFDIWGQPLSSTQVGPAQGAVIAYLNGQRHPGDPRSIPLTAHAIIQLDVGQDVPPKSFTFPPGL